MCRVRSGQECIGLIPSLSASVLRLYICYNMYVTLIALCTFYKLLYLLFPHPPSGSEVESSLETWISLDGNGSDSDTPSGAPSVPEAEIGKMTIMDKHPSNSTCR